MRCGNERIELDIQGLAPLQKRVVAPEDAKQAFFDHELRLEMARLFVEPAKREICSIVVQQVERLFAVGRQHL